MEIHDFIGHLVDYKASNIVITSRLFSGETMKIHWSETRLDMHIVSFGDIFQGKYNEIEVDINLKEMKIENKVLDFNIKTTNGLEKLTLINCVVPKKYMHYIGKDSIIYKNCCHV